MVCYGVPAGAWLRLYTSCQASGLAVCAACTMLPERMCSVWGGVAGGVRGVALSSAVMPAPFWPALLGWLGVGLACMCVTS
jgi:hypothetical protein